MLLIYRNYKMYLQDKVCGLFGERALCITARVYWDIVFFFFTFLIFPAINLRQLIHTYVINTIGVTYSVQFILSFGWFGFSLISHFLINKNSLCFIQMFPTFLSAALLLGYYKNVNRLWYHSVHTHFMYWAFVN
jgi:hypothetical protein